MQVVAIDPISDSRWDALRTAATAGLFHSPPWMSVIRDSYGFDVRAHVAVNAAGNPRGGISFCEIRDILGSRLVCLPFSDVCEPLLLGQDAWPPLRARLAEHQLPVDFRCFGGSLLESDPSLVITRRKRWHSVTLGEPLEDLRRKFREPTRRAIAKAEREGVTIRPLNGQAGLAGFLRLHVHLRKRKFRMLAQPPEFFAALAERFSAQGLWYPLGAYLGDHLLAATIYLKWGDTLYFKFNASDLAALRWRPNNLLVWGGMQLAQSLGCRALDLGPSDDNQPGLIRFKRGFGAEERVQNFLRWTPPDYPPETTAPLRHALSDITRMLTAPDVPDEVAAAAGARLYRYFA